MRSDFEKNRRALIITVAIAGVAALITQMLPPFQALPDQSASMLGLHLVLELFAIVVSMLVVMVSFHALDTNQRHADNLLIFGFAVVAGCDLAHTLSYAGMPGFITASSTSKAIFFWLIGRSFEAGALALIAANVVLPSTRTRWLWVGGMIYAVIVWIGALHTDWFPVTFIPGVGVSRFKSHYEYVLAAVNAITAVVLWSRADRCRDERLHLLSASSLLMAMGGLVLASYRTPADFANIFGHVFKVIAYALVYRAAFVFAIKEPHQLLQISERRQRENQEQLKALSDNLPNGMVYQLTVTADGTPRFLYVSAGIQQLSMGTISAEAVLRDANTLYSRILPADRPLLEAAQKAAALNMNVFNVVIRIHGGNDEVRHLRLCSRPRRQPDNSVVWDGIAIDVTDQERIDAELRKLNLELEQRVAQRTTALTQANRSLESFSYVIAHDLRAPLRHIRGYATLLSEEQGEQLSNDSQKLLAGIHTSADTMQQLIDSILALSRLEHGPLDIHRVDLSELANQIITELQTAEPQRKVKVSIEPGVNADADSVLIKNVLTNLLSNAWKFTSTKPIGAIEFGALKHNTGQNDEYGGQVVVFVRDNGMGFAPDQAQRLFDLFQRHPDHSHVAGHGIGLASVRNIVSNHGGKVWSESAPGEGATFYFSLPILQHQSVAPA